MFITGDMIRVHCVVDVQCVCITTGWTAVANAPTETRKGVFTNNAQTSVESVGTEKCVNTTREPIAAPSVDQIGKKCVKNTRYHGGDAMIAIPVKLSSVSTISPERISLIVQYGAFVHT